MLNNKVKKPFSPSYKAKMASSHQSGVLEDNIAMWEEGGKKGLTLNTRAINIIWGRDGSKGKHWKRSTDDSFEFVELLGVYWLEVTGKVPLYLLSPSTKYFLFINLKLTSTASGWDTYPVIFKLHLLGNKIASKEVKLSEHMDRGWVDVPDGGLEFLVPQDSSGMLTFAMYEIECEELKKGLVIREVKFVPDTNINITI